MQRLAMLLVVMFLVGCTAKGTPTASGTEGQLANPGTAGPAAASATQGKADSEANDSSEETPPIRQEPEAPQPVLAGAPGEPVPLAPPVPLADGAAIDAYGAYVVEVASGRLWHVARGDIRLAWAPDGTLARGSREGLDLIVIGGRPIA